MDGILNEGRMKMNKPAVCAIGRQHYIQEKTLEFRSEIP